MSIYNQDLERQLLAGLLNYPDKYIEIENFISEKDFYSVDSKVHKTIFQVIANLCRQNQKVDWVVVSERINSSGIKFEDDITVGDYVHSLSSRRVKEGAVVDVAKELKKFSVRREIYETSRKIALEMKNMKPESSYSEIVEIADKTYNEVVDRFEDVGENNVVDIYQDIEAYINEVADNPDKDKGLDIPYPTINKIYGSILRPGNIFVVNGRSGASKSTFMSDLVTKAAVLNDVGIIAIDNGELSSNEVMMRQCAALSGVPIFNLQNGSWRRNKELAAKVEAVWPKVKNLKHYYINGAGKSAEELVSLVKRIYYTKFSRGDQAILLYDYIKGSFHKDKNRQEHAAIGDLIDLLKKCVQRDIVFNGSPVISMVTGVQANRTGVTTNKTLDQVDESEASMGLSDRIVQISSWSGTLRQKLNEEIALEGGRFGTHVFTFTKTRHLGEEWNRHIYPVMTSKGPRRNYINFKIENFNCTEIGDLQDVVNTLDPTIACPEDEQDSDLPPSLR